MRSLLPPHFVNSDFNAAPINGQDLTRFSHSASPEEFVVIGSEMERHFETNAIKLIAKIKYFLWENDL